MVKRTKGWIRAKFEDGNYTFFFFRLKGIKEIVYTARVRDDRKIADRHRESVKFFRERGLKVTKWIPNIVDGKYYVHHWLCDHEAHMKKDGQFIRFI